MPCYMMLRNRGQGQAKVVFESVPSVPPTPPSSSLSDIITFIEEKGKVSMKKMVRFNTKHQSLSPHVPKQWQEGLDGWHQNRLFSSSPPENKQ